MVKRLAWILRRFPEAEELASDLFIHILSDCVASINKRDECPVATTDSAQKFLFRMLQRAAWRAEQQRTTIPASRDPEAGANCLVQPGQERRSVFNRGEGSNGNKNLYNMADESADEDEEVEFENKSVKLLNCLDWLEQRFGVQHATTMKMSYFSGSDKDEILEMMAQTSMEHRNIVDDSLLAMRLWMEHSFIQNGSTQEFTPTAAYSWVWNVLGKKYAAAMICNTRKREMKKSAAALEVTIPEYKRMVRKAEVACISLYGVVFTS